MRTSHIRLYDRCLFSAFICTEVLLKRGSLNSGAEVLSTQSTLSDNRRSSIDREGRGMHTAVLAWPHNRGEVGGA